MPPTRLLPFLACLATALLTLTPPSAHAQSRPHRASSATSPDLRVEIDWPAFLGRHDLVWEKLPAQWHEGAFLGNGLLGAMIYLSEDGKSLRWDLGRSDVTDRSARIPLGTLTLQTVGTLQGGTMRLDLWNAQVTGTLRTDCGEIRFASLTHATDLVTIIDLQPTEGERAATWSFAPGLAASAAKVHEKKPLTDADRNPPPETGQTADTRWVLQPLKDNAEHATAWREVTRGDRRQLFVTTAFRQTNPSTPATQPATTPGAARTDALASVAAAARTPLADFIRPHRTWWHDYWPQSFVSLPDTRLESFYAIQMYKLGAATRADRPAIDLMGPWFRSTPWAAIWWNLNIQLTYSPLYTANRLSLGESLTTMLTTHQLNLVNNAPHHLRADSAFISRTSSYDLKGYGWYVEFGSLTWALHSHWLQYRYSMDERHLRDLFPLLRRSVNYMMHQLEPGPDGTLHFKKDISPEYDTQATDTNYNLSLLRWGLQTLLAANDLLRADDPLAPRWREVQAQLAPYPVDPATGLMIGRDVPLAMSHRHYSHLLMIYPLYLMNWDQPENRPLIEKSLDHWISFKGALQGYSYTGAAALKAQMGRGDDAAKLLDQFLDGYAKPNTMYLEAGPVIETPLAGASTVHEMLLQSWGGKIRVFPAVPASWPDATFHQLRAEGAFLVSASRRAGRTEWIQIESLAGQPATLVADFLPEGRELRLKKGERLLLRAPHAASAPAIVAPVAPQEWRLNFYGSRKATATPPLLTDAATGAFALPAVSATILGESLFVKKEDPRPCLAYWVKPRDIAVWTIQVKKPGRYQVASLYGAPGNSPNRYYVKIGDQKLTAPVRNAGGYDAAPTEFEVGEIQLDKAGLVTVEVGPEGELSGGLFNLHALRLVPKS
jgi:hypothetical protein